MTQYPVDQVNATFASPAEEHAHPAAEPASDSERSEARSLATDSLKKPAILLLLLALLTFVLYIGTLSFPFVWDDVPLVPGNPLIHSWKNLPQAFRQDLWHHVNNFPKTYYRPLFAAWLTLNYSIFHLNPWGWHLAAMLAHIGAVFAVFALARKLALGYWTAALAALAFACHPAHVEVVSWVTCASDAIVTILFAFSFISFLNSRDKAQIHPLLWRIASLFLLACALLIKEMAVTFVGIVLVYVWLFADPQSNVLARIRQSILATIPYALLTLVYLVVRKLALHHIAAPVSGSHFLAMVLTWPAVLCKYIQILVLPLNLSALYYHPYVEHPGVKNFLVPLLIVFATALVIGYWARRTKEQVVAFAGIWMLVTLAPALYLVTFRFADFVHDRYLYLPSVGFVILLAKAIELLPTIRSFSAPAVRVAIASILTLAYCAGSYAQQVYWSSELLIFHRAHSLHPENDFATVELARELSHRGRYDRAVELLAPLVEGDSHKGSSYPRYYLYYLLGDSYMRTGQNDRAREALERVISTSPDNFESGPTRTSVAALFAHLGNLDRALAICSAATQRTPVLNTTLFDCTDVYLAAGRSAELEKILQAAALASPDQPVPYYLLGRVELQTGRTSEAEITLRKAVQLDSTIFDYHYWYARALALRGDVPDARRELLAALAINSNSDEAKAALATLPDNH
jgi:tetratricopeptide (TPR) repeat protein